MTEVVLFHYWRSSASYRVRIALNLKGVAWTSHDLDLTRGEEKAEDYRARNPQGFVPMLAIDGHDLTQSLAIIDYLDAKFPEPRMVSRNAAARSKTLAEALIVATDIHPINNLRILKYLKNTLGHSQAEIDVWAQHWVAEGFSALEALAPAEGLFGGDAPNLADVCLVPQMYNARRVGTDLAAFPRLLRIDAALTALPAVAAAAPEAVKPKD